MRSTRKSAVLLTVLVVAILALTPTLASALLINEWDMEFAGQTKCLECHMPQYGDTTHSKFATPAADPSEAYMWPAGRIGIGLSLESTDVAFTLGYNTGLREYLAWDAAYIGDPMMPVRMREGIEWDPALPETWEYAADGIADADYTCYRCHMLGPQTVGSKPSTGTFSVATTATMNAWAVTSFAATNTIDGWIPGSSIQCERCHGVGVAATAAEGGHWNSGVKVVGGWSSDRFGLAASRNILDSGVCGQCHGTFKSGNVWGFTTDQLLQKFVTPYSVAESYVTPSRFFPNGQNKGMKHSYYSEWTVSGHALRPRVPDGDPRETEYNKAGLSHFNPATASTYCFKCHTGEGYMKRKNIPVMTDFPNDTSQQGYYGQECVACHVSHGAGTASGMGVREPDAAGEGSNAGLATANNSICEDCHNWQAEISGSPVVPTTSGRGPSHPQRELYNGRGLFDVTQADMFMPGVRCEECHMPATKSDFPDKTGLERYANQSWKRYSHRMFIMEPGEAESYSLAPWGDSCSPCHAGEDQASLQANIDGWQSDASALDTAAVDAIAAARLRPEFGTTAGAQLVGRAYVNEKMFLNDASGGAHNPPYIQAGLAKAVQLADSVGGTFDVLYAPDAIFLGNFAAIATTILDGDGTPAEDAVVTLEKNTGGGWTQVGQTMTDANGNAAFIEEPTVETSYRFRWRRSTSTTLADKYSDTMTVGLETLPTTLSARSSSYYVPLNGVFTLSGRLAPADPGATLKIYYKWSGSTADWKLLTTSTVGPTGSYSKNIKTWRRGYWYYKVVYEGSATLDPSSVTATVRCR